MDTLIGIAAAGLFLATAAGAQPSPITVRGRVIDTLVAPVVGATVDIDRAALTATTNARGEYRLIGVASGQHLLTIRKIGFRPVQLSIETPRDTLMAPVIMTPGPVELPAVVANTIGPFDKPARLAYTTRFDAFFERRKFNAGSGQFYTNDDIDRMHVMTFLDVLRRLPHLQLWEQSGHITFRFPTCGMSGTLIEWNGVTIWGGGGGGGSATLQPSAAGAGNSDIGPFDAVRNLTADRIEGIEVYPSSSSLPAQAVGNACAAIFIWTQ